MTAIATTAQTVTRIMTNLWILLKGVELETPSEYATLVGFEDFIRDEVGTMVRVSQQNPAEQCNDESDKRAASSAIETDHRKQTVLWSFSRPIFIY